jgi:hypothetical protein
MGNFLGDFWKFWAIFESFGGSQNHIWSPWSVAFLARVKVTLALGHFLPETGGRQPTCRRNDNSAGDSSAGDNSAGDNSAGDNSTDDNSTNDNLTGGSSTGNI